MFYPNIHGIYQCINFLFLLTLILVLIVNIDDIYFIIHPDAILFRYDPGTRIGIVSHNILKINEKKSLAIIFVNRLTRCSAILSDQSWLCCVVVTQEKRIWLLFGPFIFGIVNHFLAYKLHTMVEHKLLFHRQVKITQQNAEI